MMGGLLFSAPCYPSCSGPNPDQWSAMKDRFPNYLSLVFSVAAFGYAAWVHQGANRAAVAALRQRELELVRFYAPHMQEVIAAMTETTAPATSPPETLEELFRPLVNIIEKFQGSGPTVDPPALLKIPDEVPQ